jgi:PKD repeat protein
LTVKNNLGVSAVSTTNATITNRPIPVINGPYQGLVGTAIQFSSNGSYDPDPGDSIKSYLWEFGNGATSSSANPQYSYSAAGLYSVKLTVTDSFGATNSATTTATINTNANTPPTASILGPSQAFVGVATYFTSNSYDPDGSIVKYFWEFGDGYTSALANPQHAYTMPGLYSVRLTVTDNLGAVGVASMIINILQSTTNTPPVSIISVVYQNYIGAPVKFSSANSYDPDGYIKSYYWTFGDNTSSVEANPIHIYYGSGIFVSYLTVTDNLDAKHTSYAIINVAPNLIPTAVINGPYQGVKGGLINFTSSGSIDPDGSIVSYLWDFGDNTTSYLANPQHVYSVSGIFTIALTVTDNKGATHTATSYVTVQKVNSPPIAFINGPYQGDVGNAIQFSSAGSYDSDGAIVSYFWDFGDKSTSSLASPQHVYNLAGSYTAVLMVTDDQGATDYKTTTVQVNQPVSIVPTYYAQLPYSTSFETGALDKYWNVKTSSSVGRIQVTTADYPVHGLYHLTMDTSTSGSNINEAWLNLDLSGQTNVELTFRWRDLGDDTDSYDGVYFSNDGGKSFVKVLNFTPSALSDTWWSSFTLDVDELAKANGLALTKTFVVKFQQLGYFSSPGDGMAIDEVFVRGNLDGYSPIYSTNFEKGTVDSNWSFQRSTSNGNILVNALYAPHSGYYHLTMDTLNFGYNVNSAMLNLNLEGETDVELAFWLKEFNDETHPDDGVYFSNNGGASFVKAYDFMHSDYLDSRWVKYYLDVDELARQNGITLTSNFVVKFQQGDDYMITTDGIALDDVTVSSRKAQLPYFNDFESGTLDKNWTFSNSDPSGLVQVTTQNGPYAGAYHLTMDKSTYDGLSVLNEASITLNLASEQNVRLEFYWKEFYDELDPDDGVFISEDGVNFYKIYTLDTTSNSVWLKVSLDLDQLAAANGIKLSGNFVIKFQHRDNYPINSDGFAFDNISVTRD